MFCSGCGTQIQEGLNYCSRCGRRIDRDTPDALAAMSSSVIAAYTGGVGFLAFIFVVLILAKNGFPSGDMTKIAFLYFAALFGICFLILRQGSFKTTGTLPRSVDANGDPAAPVYLRPTATAQLVERPEAEIGSIVDHTTRDLEEVTAQRK